MKSRNYLNNWSNQTRVGGRASWLGSLLLSLLTFLLLASSSYDCSPAFGEPEALATASHFRATGALGPDPFPPPLLVLLIAPTFGLPPGPPSWFCHRLPLILVASLFAGFYFRVLLHQLGFRTAILASLMMISLPTFLGQAPLLRTELLGGVVAFLYFSTLAQYLRRPGRLQVVRLAFCYALCLLTRFSLAWVILWAFRALWRRAGPQKRSHFSLLLGLSLTTLWMVYAICGVSQDQQQAYNREVFQGRSGPVVRLLDSSARTSVLRPLAWYATGWWAQSHTAQRLARSPAVLSRPVWEVPLRLTPTPLPLALANKLPPATLLLCLLGTWGLYSKRKSLPREVALYASWGLICSIVAFIGENQQGVRQLLPCFPILFAALAYGAQLLVKSPRWLGLAAFSLVLTALWGWPFYLSYFNLLSGKLPLSLGPDYDCGTDLGWLNRRVRQEQWSELPLLYDGPCKPEALLGPGYPDLTPDHLPRTGRAAISANLYYPLCAWARTSSPDPQRRLWADWLEHWKPYDQVGAILLLRPQDQEGSRPPLKNRWVCKTEVPRVSGAFYPFSPDGFWRVSAPTTPGSLPSWSGPSINFGPAWHAITLHPWSETGLRPQHRLAYRTQNN